MRAIACWDKSDAEKILRTEALQGDAAIFTAVHTTLHSIKVSGPLAASLSETSEHSVLSLLSAERAHALCIVRGLPGAGKSHLIRWLWAHWKVPGDEPFLVPRADGSLTGTLRRLREQLGGEYESLFAGLADESRVALEGRANDFQSRIANSLREGYYEGVAPVHADFCARNKVHELIGGQQVLGRWAAPRRILRILSGAAAEDERGERDQASANFFLSDIAELARAATAERSLSPSALLFRTFLRKEAQKLEPLIDARRSDAEILETLGDGAIPNSLKLVDALNMRRNDAVRALLGLGRHALKDLFRKLRVELKARGKRLVLMLEDVTSFEGVDDQLIEVVIQRSDIEGNDNLCSLVAICGVTPDYYDKLVKVGNVEDRIDLHVVLAGDGNVLSTGEDRRTFAGRYLRAIRAGVSTLRDSEAPSNRCVGCPQRPDCHRDFGTARVDEDNVGLYPFNSRSLDTLFEELEDTESRGKRVQTPRGFLKAVLAPTLLEPQHIIDGAFPTAQVETTWHPERARQRLGTSGGVMGRALEARMPGIALHEQQRARRLMAWWGNWKSPKTERDEETGELTFGTVPKGVFETFGLPWVGEESADYRVKVEPPDEPKNVVSTDDLQGAGDRSRPPLITPPTIQETREVPGVEERKEEKKKRGEKKPEKIGNTDQRFAELAKWRDGGDLESDAFWNGRLAQLVDGLPWGQLEIDRWTQQEFFTTDLVSLEGTKHRRLETYFVVPRGDVIASGLQALVSLESDPAMSPEQNWYSIAECVRCLGNLARAHVRRLFQGEDGAQWDFRPRLVQALLARAYGRGRTEPGKPIIEQWAVLFERAGELTDAARGRVESWQTLLNDTKVLGDLPSVFERALGVHRPDGKTDIRLMSDLLDASSAAPALVRFRRTLKFDELGPAQELKGEKFVLIRKFLEWTKLSSRLDKIAGWERDRLRRMLDEIDTVSGGRSMSEHLEDVRKVLNTAAAQAPDFVALHLAEWQKLRSEIFGTVESAPLDPMWERVDKTVEEAIDARTSIDARVGAEALHWCLSVPAWEIARASELLNRLDVLIARLNTDLKSRVETKLGDTDDLEAQLSAVDTTLTEALNRLEPLLGGSS